MNKVFILLLFDTWSYSETSFRIKPWAQKGGKRRKSLANKRWASEQATSVAFVSHI